MKYFLLSLIIPLTLLTNAQQATSSNTEKYPKVKWCKKLKIAKKKIAEGSYYNAAQYLEDAYKDKPTKIVIPHLLGEVNRQLRDYQAAEKYYGEAVKIDPEAYATDQFYLAQMQKQNGKYEDAKKTFNDYLKVKLGKKDVNLKSLAKIEIEGCDTALALLKAPSKIKVTRTEGNVNSTIQDFAPKPLKDKILFSSQKTDTAVNITTSKANYYTSIFTADKAGKVYTGKTELPVPPNDPQSSTANAILSTDGNTLIYTKCFDSITADNRIRCKLYRSTKKNDLEWNEGEELKSLNNEDGTTTEPAWGVDADGSNILYFVSDRKGSKGLDIYYAKINSDGTFGAIQPAGKEINTEGNDVTPFYDAKNKILYFSSDGHPSIGGLDVFKSAGVPGNWGPAVNAGIPINSPADDLYLALDDKAAKGFMVSNRVGTTSPRGATCCDDIWTVIIQNDVTLKVTYVKRGDPTNTPIIGVDASLYKVSGNNFDFVGNAITTSSPSLFSPMNRGTSYKMNGNKEGYWPSIDNLTIDEEEDRDTIEKTFYMDPIIKIHIKIPNVYFAFDKSDVIKFYKEQIDSVVKVLTDHPGYSVEVQGYTDSKGSDEYNEKLSKRRADEVKKFLIKKKDIPEARIVTKYFGEKNPAVPNELPNGEDDPEGRARNRRVEFKVIPDKPEDAPEFESYGEVVKEVKTGPGFTRGKTHTAKKK